MQKILFTLFALLLAGSAAAQVSYLTARTAKGKALSSFQQGDRLIQTGQLDAALRELEKALTLAPNFIDAQIEWANVKNQQGKLAEAELGYEKALGIDSSYETGVFYSLGIVEFELKKFREAAGHFEQFLQKATKISDKKKSNAGIYLKNSRFAARAIENPVPYQPVNLGPAINTREAEYLPTPGADGESLTYTAVRNGQEDFYQSKKVNGVWQPGVPLTSINTEDNEGAQSLSADGKFMVFTACHRPGGKGSCDLFFAELRNGKWSTARNLGAPINSSGWESQPSLSADGRTLFFAAETRESKNGKEIMVSHLLPNGTWSAPESLGPPINTPGDEQAPFMHADGQTLYFMSNGHPGMGGFDLFLSRRRPDGSWGEPENLGFPVNSEGNEGALAISLDGKTAYFATDVLNVQQEGLDAALSQGKESTDIYSFELPVAARPLPVTYVKALVYNEKDKRPLSALVEVTDLSTGKTYATAQTEKDGLFLITLPTGRDYALNVSCEKFLFASENFALSETADLERPFLLEIPLIPIPDEFASEGNSKPIVLKNVFFESASATLKPESQAELDRLVRLLQLYPKLRIQINGHTDNVGSDADNQRLSEGRAKAVYGYLTGKGVEAGRLQYKGFGESRPIAPNDTEAGRQQNRRTEFEVIK
jgi:outer membrane protein OmpA-like peptidoglycan-associated protein